jgi:PhnB protein
VKNMMTLTPYLSFNGNCAEAMEFYKSCLGGELEVSKVGDSPMAKDMPGKEDHVMHSTLKSGGISLMASDLMMDGHATPGTNITLTLSGGSLAELKEMFEKLSEGGKVTQPLKAAFFGTYGDLTDKYGFHWAFQSDEKAE